MADTGEARELKQRVSAHQAEVIRESKKLVEKTSKRAGKRPGKKNPPGAKTGRQAR